MCDGRASNVVPHRNAVSSDSFASVVFTLLMLYNSNMSIIVSFDTRTYFALSPPMHPLVIIDVSTRKRPIEFVGGTACGIDANGNPASSLLREVLSVGLAFVRHVHAK